MTGRRILPNRYGDFPAAAIKPGDFFFHETFGWNAKTPNGFMANLGGHEITEHDDGTITAHPSILIRAGNEDEVWHGFLERGVWRACK